MYYLAEDVFIVRGTAKDCIYDLNKGKLYHVSHDVSWLIDELSVNSEIWEKHKDTVDYLISQNLIEFKETGKNKDITSLKSANRIKIAWIEVCTFCNLKCIHCYNDSSPMCHTFMNYSDFQFVCDSLKNYGIKRIQIIGGEPFCNSHICEMLEYANRCFDSVEIFTNATLLSPSIIDQLKKLGTKVAISLYSNLEEHHEIVTKTKGSYSNTVSSISQLKKAGVPYRISNILMDGIELGKNNSELFHMKKHRSVIKMAGRGNLGLLNEELLKIKMITKESFSEKFNRNLIIERINGHQCFSQKVYISAKLDVFPCVMERRLCHGNLRNKSLDEVLNPTIMSLNKDCIEECKCCEFRYACFDCRPDNIGGNIQTKPYYCTYSVKEGTWKSPDIIVSNVLSI